MSRITPEIEQVIRIAEGRDYPYGSDLRTGCRFYPDEAYEDGIDRSAKTPQEMHPNACTCDTCSDPAQFMTFCDEDTALYICERCIEKFALEALVDREPFVPGVMDWSSIKDWHTDGDTFTFIDVKGNEEEIDAENMAAIAIHHHQNKKA